MSENKKQTTTEGSETGKNRSYFNIPDPCTKDGSGAMEQVLMAFGQNRPEAHWRNHRKHNPYAQVGYQRHYSAQTDGGLVLEDSARCLNEKGKHQIFGLKMTPEIKILNTRYFNEIIIPSMKKRQEARLLNKTGTKSEKMARLSTAQYELWTNEPEQLEEYVLEKNIDTINTLRTNMSQNPIYTPEIIDAMVLDTIKAMAKGEMDKRKPTKKTA